MIPSVLADRPQSFDTAQQRQARENINAQIAGNYQPSGDYAYNSALSSKLDASASSQFITSTAGLQPSGDYAYNSSLSSKLDASASGMFQPSGNYITYVTHDSNLSGSGTSGSPLGLNQEIWLTNTGMPYSATLQTYMLQFSGESGEALYGLSDVRLSASSNDYTHMTEYGLDVHGGDFSLSAGPSSIYIDEHNGSNADASFTHSSLTFTERNKPTAQLTNDKLYFQDELGALTYATASYDTYGAVWKYPLPGWGVATGSVGMTGMFCMGDLSAYSGMYIAHTMDMSGYDNRIRISVSTAGNQFGIMIANSSETGWIYPSSINKWNNCISSVSAGYGVKGDGVTTALSVSGLAYDESSIYQTSTNHISSNIEMTMDDHRSAVFSTYGVRITETGAAPNHSSLAELGNDHLNLHDYQISAQTYVTPSGIILSDSATTVTIAASSWNSLTAWAAAQGWNP